MHSDTSLFFKLFVFRLAVSLLVNVREHPDEYWQCQEPAYHFVYGRGNLTYEWVVGMRSYVFLLPYILGMVLAKYARSLESYMGPFAFLARDVESWLLWHWRPLVAVFTAAVIDLYTLKVARKFIGSGKILDRWVLLLMATNSGLIKSLVRPYSNCTEAMLSLVALHLWPMKAADWSRKYARESSEIKLLHSLFFRLESLDWHC
jgi:phosphatidylinositol glycan class B